MRISSNPPVSAFERSSVHFCAGLSFTGLVQRVASLAAVASGCFALAATALAGDGKDAFEVSGPHVKDNLAVYFIHGKSQPGPVPLTLAEALRAKRVTVHETGQVQQLLIENTGDREVFVQAGDIVKGGRQDRVLTISLLIPPKSGKISIGSYCVEQGRWSRRGVESADRFASAETAMPSKAAKITMLSARRSASRPSASQPQMRGLLTGAVRGGEQQARRAERLLRNPEQRMAAASRARPSRQQEVWRNVADIQRKLSANLSAGVRSNLSASSLQLSLEHQKLVEARQKLAARFLPLGTKSGDVIGYAFAINGRINSAEIYPSNGLFRKMWPKLIKASVTEAIAGKDAAANGASAPKKEAIKAFLDDSLKGKAQKDGVMAVNIERERRETDKAMALETRRSDGRIVHWSVLAY